MGGGEGGRWGDIGGEAGEAGTESGRARKGAEGESGIDRKGAGGEGGKVREGAEGERKVEEGERKVEGERIGEGGSISRETGVSGSGGPSGSTGRGIGEVVGGFLGAGLEGAEAGMGGAGSVSDTGGGLSLPSPSSLALGEVGVGGQAGVAREAGLGGGGLAGRLGAEVSTLRGAARTGSLGLTTTGTFVPQTMQYFNDLSKLTPHEVQVFSGSGGNSTCSPQCTQNLRFFSSG